MTDFPPNRRGKTPGSAFTLIELLLALVMAAAILAAVYGVYSSAFHLRDHTTDRLRNERLRERAAKVLRDDLANAIITGGTLASMLSTTAGKTSSNFPGYLCFTTTTGRDTDDELYGDVQEVSYSIITDQNSASNTAGLLVRDIDRNLLATTRETTHEEELLTGVESMEVEFYNGQDWTETVQLTGSNDLPKAVRVRIQQAAAVAKETPPPAIEVLVPWTTERQAAMTTGT